MRRDGLKLFTTPLTPSEKEVLVNIARASGLSMSGVIRQLLIQEYRKPSHRKHLATHHTRVARRDR